MAITGSQQAFKNLQAVEKLLGVPTGQQVHNTTITKVPDLGELMPGINVENLAKALTPPEHDSFHKS